MIRNKLRLWLTLLLRCRHKHFKYQFDGGKSCPYDKCNKDCPGDCSIPVYLVTCTDCGMDWTLGEDELIGFFARQDSSHG